MRLTSIVNRALTSIGTTLRYHLTQVPHWDPRHFLGTCLLLPLAEAIFITIIQLALFSNHLLPSYIGYLISVVSNKFMIKMLLHFKESTFAPPPPPNERQEGCFLPSAPSLISLIYDTSRSILKDNTCCQPMGHEYKALKPYNLK